MILKDNQLEEIKNFIDESEKKINKFKGQAEIAKNQSKMKEKVDDLNKSIIILKELLILIIKDLLKTT
jgi:hypothetical protein